MFDWRSFLDRFRIDYSERGPSTSKDNLYFKCPFCGEADGGKHMGVSLKGKGWGCWRNASHRGRAPQRLIRALLGCGWQEANLLAGQGGRGPAEADAGLLGAVRRAMGQESPEAPSGPALTLPKGFRSASGQSPALHYLRERGYDRKQVQSLIREYDLHWSWDGEWAYRIIFPVRDENERLVSWTGRSVDNSVRLRYKSLTTDPEKAHEGRVALQPISDCLLGIERLTGGHALVLCEGPFDQLRLNAFGDASYQATCLFGKVVSESQLDLLAMLRPLYDHIFLVLDPDAMADALRIAGDLTALKVHPLRLEGDDDPGEMSVGQIKKLTTRMERVAAQAK